LRWHNDKRNIVYNVTQDDLKKLTQVHSERAFAVYQQPERSGPASGEYRFEVVYAPGRNVFSLLRTHERRAAEEHIKQFKNIIPILVAGSGTPKPSLCQAVVDTAINNPNWFEYHIAASVSDHSIVLDH